MITHFKSLHISFCVVSTCVIICHLLFEEALCLPCPGSGLTPNERWVVGKSVGAPSSPSSSPFCAHVCWQVAANVSVGIARTALKGNTAATAGGGVTVMVSPGALVTFDNTNVSANTAGVGGGVAADRCSRCWTAACEGMHCEEGIPFGTHNMLKARRGLLGVLAVALNAFSLRVLVGCESLTVC